MRDLAVHRWLLRALLATLCACAGGRTAAPPASTDPLEARIDAIVTRYEKALVLGASDIEGDEVTIVGKVLFDRNRHDLDALADDLAIAATDDPPLFDAFLEAMAFRGNDALAFEAVVLQLTRSDDVGAPFSRRLRQRREEIRATKRAYRTEMRAVLDKLGTRGGPASRPTWDEYMATLRGKYSAQDVLDEHLDLFSDDASPTRGTGLIFGFKLPPRHVVLTFDDGPHPEYTPALLDILDDRGAKAIFFEVGNNVGTPTNGGVTLKAGAALTKDILERGHLLGNHTWNHKYLPKLGDAQIARQIDTGRSLLEAASGREVMLFRPPYGGRNAEVLDVLGRRDMKGYIWNVDSRDWADPIPESIVATTLEQLDKQGRGVLLFHDVHPQTLDAIPQLLDELAARKYEIVLWDGTDIVKGPRRVVAAPPPAELYHDSWAVVIGIDDYQHWPRLAYARNDAEAVRERLVDDLGFDRDKVLTLTDAAATKDRILALLGDELPNKVTADDRVFVFFAGHGTTRTLPGGRQRGYIVPVDASLDSYQATAISMTALQDVQEAIPAKHVLFVMDACYSGIALTRGGGFAGDPRRYLEEVTRRPARQILTAGGADEEVADGGPEGHSIFTWTLLQGLAGQADLDQDGFITATELNGYVAPRVSALSRQTPTFGNLVGSAGGEFVFELEGRTAPPAALSGDNDDDGDTASLKARNAALVAELNRLRERLDRMATRGGGEPTRLQADLANARGKDLFHQGDRQGALEQFTLATDADPNHPEAVNNRGFTLYVLKRDDEALPWLRRAIELDPARAVAYVNLADCLARLGKRDEALPHYRTYLEMMPRSAIRGRVEAYLDRG